VPKTSFAERKDGALARRATPTEKTPTECMAIERRLRWARSLTLTEFKRPATTRMPASMPMMRAAELSKPYSPARVATAHERGVSTVS